MRRGLALAAAALALTACEQTLHLYAIVGTGGSSGITGKGGNSGSGGSGNLDGGAPDARCFGSSQTLTVTPDSPSMVVVLDRSTNMNQSFGSMAGSETHLEAALTALQGQIAVYKNIHYSFITFPDQSNGCQPQTGCCSGDVQSDWMSFNTAVYACDGPSPPSYCLFSPSRPTATALAKADTALTGSSSKPGQRYVLLITDGQPTGGCAPPNDCQAAVTDVGTLSDHKVNVSIVGIQSDLGCLQLAFNPTGQPAVQTVSDPTTLGTVLNGIMQSAVCNATLSPAPQSWSDLQVTFSGNIVPPASNAPGSNGWTYDSTYGHLHLRGSACQNVIDAWEDLKVTTSCGSGHTPGGPTSP
jgi:hypothetical protein